MKKYLIPPYEFLKKKLKIAKRTFIAPKIPKNADGKVFVNLGCGNNSGREFTNVDVLKFPNIHHIHEIEKLPMFADNSVDMVYGSHVVEHIPMERLMAALTEWKRVLKPGGIFRFSVPDFDQIIKIYEGNNRDVKSVRDQILGQKPPYDNHYSVWNRKFGEEILTKAGFTNIRTWSPETADHHDFKDRSSRALDTTSGSKIPVSLNLEAEK